MRRARAWALWAGLVFSPPTLAAEGVDGEARPLLQKVEQSLEDWNLPGARQALAALEASLSEDSEPLRYVRGRVAFEEGRYGEAVDLLTSAGVEDRNGSYLRLAKETAKVTRDHRTAESEHFIFQYPPGKDEVLVPYALEALEATRTALLQDLGYAPEGKVRVEVVNNARELSKVSTLTLPQIQTTGTIAICKFNKLMVTSPKAVLKGYDWMDTLAHEYVHLVVSQKSRNTVPIWLHEGMAKYLETRWRGEAGRSMSPSTLALLGHRVQKNKLIPFEKMHPSIALLPSAEDAATAFAEVFFAVDYVTREKGTAGLRAVIDGLAAGKSDRKAVEAAMEMSFPQFEKAWLGHVRKQPFPRELIPRSDEKIVLKESAAGKAAPDERKGREISFGDFVEVTETEARKFAHLGELMRERRRTAAAAEEYGKAHRRVGDKYESISNKYALALLELKRVDAAEKVLLGSLRMHPGSAATQVHLGRIYLARNDHPRAKRAFLDALASDPFDEEIHLSLAHVHDALGEKALAERAARATGVLTGLKPEQVTALARTLGERGKDLSEGPAGVDPQPFMTVPDLKPRPQPQTDAGTL